MPGALRLRDIDTNMNRMTDGSHNVFVNKLKFCRFTDPDDNGDTINRNVSPNVFVNGLNAAYIGSVDSSNHTKITGSSNVFVNGE